MKVTLQVEFNNLDEVKAFLVGTPGGQSFPVTVTTAPAEEQLPKEPAIQPTEEVATEKRKRRTKAEMEAAKAAEAPAQPEQAVISEAQREEIRNKLKAFMQKNGLPQAEALLAKYNAKRVMDLQASDYDAFSKDLEG